MSPKIDASNLFVRHYLVVRRKVVKFYNSAGGWRVRSFPFGAIDCVLLSPSDVLSFQVGTEVFSIPMNTAKPRHRLTVETLTERVRQAYSPSRITYQTPE